MHRDSIQPGDPVATAEATWCGTATTTTTTQTDWAIDPSTSLTNWVLDSSASLTDWVTEPSTDRVMTTLALRAKEVFHSSRELATSEIHSLTMSGSHVAATENQAKLTGWTIADELKVSPDTDKLDNSTTCEGEIIVTDADIAARGPDTSNLFHSDIDTKILKSTTENNDANSDATQLKKNETDTSQDRDVTGSARETSDSATQGSEVTTEAIKVTSQDKDKTDTAQDRDRNKTDSTQDREITGTAQDRNITDTMPGKNTTDTTQDRDTTVTAQDRDTTDTAHDRDTTDTTQDRDMTETTQDRDITDTTQDRDITQTTQDRDITDTAQNRDITDTAQNRDIDITDTAVKACDSVTQDSHVTIRASEVTLQDSDIIGNATEANESTTDDSKLTVEAIKVTAHDRDINGTYTQASEATIHDSDVTRTAIEVTAHDRDIIDTDTKESDSTMHDSDVTKPAIEVTSQDRDITNKENDSTTKNGNVVAKLNELTTTYNPIVTASYETTAEEIDTAKMNSETTRKEDDYIFAQRNETTSTNTDTNTTTTTTTITPTPTTTTTTTTIRTQDCCVFSETNETTTDDSHIAVQPIETKTKVGDISIIYRETKSKKGSITATHKACTISGSHNRDSTEDEEGTLTTCRASLMNSSAIENDETSTMREKITTAKDNSIVEHIRWNFHFSGGNEAKESITNGIVRWAKAPIDESRTMTLEIEKITRMEESTTDRPTLLCSIRPDRPKTYEYFIDGPKTNVSTITYGDMAEKATKITTMNSEIVNKEYNATTVSSDVATQETQFTAKNIYIVTTCNQTTPNDCVIDTKAAKEDSIAVKGNENKSTYKIKNSTKNTDDSKTFHADIVTQINKKSRGIRSKEHDHISDNDESSKEGEEGTQTTDSLCFVHGSKFEIDKSLIRVEEITANNYETEESMKLDFPCSSDKDGKSCDTHPTAINDTFRTIEIDNTIIIVAPTTQRILCSGLQNQSVINTNEDSGVAGKSDDPRDKLRKNSSSEEDGQTTSNNDDSSTEEGARRTGIASSMHDSTLESRKIRINTNTHTEGSIATNTMPCAVSKNQSVVPFEELQNATANTRTFTSNIHQGVSHQCVTTAGNVGISMKQNENVSPQLLKLTARESYNKSNQFGSASTAWKNETSQLDECDVGVDDCASNEGVSTQNTEQFTRGRIGSTGMIDESNKNGWITEKKRNENLKLENEIATEVSNITSEGTYSTKPCDSTMSLPVTKLGQNVPFIATTPTVNREIAAQSEVVDNLSFEQVNAPATNATQSTPVTNNTTTRVNFVSTLTTQTALMAVALSTMAASFNCMSTQLQTNTAPKSYPIALSSIVDITNHTVTGATNVNKISEDLIVMVNDTSTMANQLSTKVLEQHWFPITWSCVHDGMSGVTSSATNITTTATGIITMATNATTMASAVISSASNTRREAESITRMASQIKLLANRITSMATNITTMSGNITTLAHGINAVICG